MIATYLKMGRERCVLRKPQQISSGSLDCTCQERAARVERVGKDCNVSLSTTETPKKNI